jgi:hypothetical protein
MAGFALRTDELEVPVNQWSFIPVIETKAWSVTIIQVFRGLSRAPA